MMEGKWVRRCKNTRLWVLKMVSATTEGHKERWCLTMWRRKRGKDSKLLYFTLTVQKKATSQPANALPVHKCSRDCRKSGLKILFSAVIKTFSKIWTWVSDFSKRFVCGFVFRILFSHINGKNEDGVANIYRWLQFPRVARCEQQNPPQRIESRKTHKSWHSCDFQFILESLFSSNDAWPLLSPFFNLATMYLRFAMCSDIMMLRLTYFPNH